MARVNLFIGAFCIKRMTYALLLYFDLVLNVNGYVTS